MHTTVDELFLILFLLYTYYKDIAINSIILTKNYLDFKR